MVAAYRARVYSDPANSLFSAVAAGGCSMRESADRNR
jgi:hypothetical protein